MSSNSSVLKVVVVLLLLIQAVSDIFSQSQGVGDVVVFFLLLVQSRVHRRVNIRDSRVRTPFSPDIPVLRRICGLSRQGGTLKG
jgi:hypothetical protein